MLTDQKVDVEVSLLRIELKELTPDDLANLARDILTLYDSKLISMILYQKEVESWKGPKMYLWNKIAFSPKYFPEDIYEILKEAEETLANSTLIASVLPSVQKWVLPEYRLHVVRINYNSPGAFDLVGLGKVMQEIKEFILSLRRLKMDRTTYDDSKELRDVELMTKKIELEEKRIQLDHKKRMQDLEYQQRLEEITASSFLKKYEKPFLSETELGNNAAKALAGLLKLLNKENIGELKIVEDDE